MAVNGEVGRDDDTEEGEADDAEEGSDDVADGDMMVGLDASGELAERGRLAYPGKLRLLLLHVDTLKLRLEYRGFGWLEPAVGEGE